MSAYVIAITYIHTAISLIALFLGIFAIAGLFLGTRVPKGWTDWFLITAVATSVTGFFFPFAGVTPAIIVGIIALLILAVVLLARYSYHYAGAWRWIYAAGMVISVYLIAFVGVVQAFLKVPFLNVLAPTGTEPAFLVAQTGTLIAFVALGILAAIKFKGLIEDIAKGRHA